MRRITLLLAAILTVCSLNAQKGNKNEKVVNIDKVNYRITYNGENGTRYHNSSLQLLGERNATGHR